MRQRSILTLLIFLLGHGCAEKNNNGPTVGIEAFSVSSSLVSPGETVTLEWRVQNAARVLIVASTGGLVTESTEATGSIEPAAVFETTTYTLTAEGEGGPVVRTARVTVGDAPPEAPVIDDFVAQPSVVTPNSDTVFSWVVRRATQVRILEDNNEIFSTSDSVASGSSPPVRVVQEQRFVLEASNAQGSVTRELWVTVAPMRMETEPNDDPLNDMLDDLTESPLIAGTISDAQNDVDYFRVVVRPGQNLKISVTDPDGFGCSVPSLVELYRPASMSLLAQNDDRLDGQGLCSLIDPRTHAGAADLPGGVMIIAVRAESPQAAPFQYLLTVTISEAGCGNGIREESRMEQCDDGNRNNGDGCSRECQTEPLGFVEGLDRETVFMGALDRPGAGDIYQVSFQEPGYIFAETGVPEIGECISGADTVLHLTDNDGVEIQSNDDVSPENRCSLIEPSENPGPLPPGVYLVRVSSFMGVPLGPYGLKIRTVAAGCGNGIWEPNEGCEDGNRISGDGCSEQCEPETTSVVFESEPNGSPNQADSTGLMRGSQTEVSGFIDTVGDSDFWRISVPIGPPLSLRAQTYTEVGNVMVCEQDTRITLFDAQGMVLADDDDGGAETCSLLPDQMGPVVLDAGVYFLAVRHFNDTMAYNQPYFMKLELQ